MQALASGQGKIIFSLRLGDESVSKERCSQEDSTQVSPLFLRLVQKHRSADAVELSSEAFSSPQ